MTNEEFYELHKELEGAYLKLNYLQNEYRKETGRSFVQGQPFIAREEQVELCNKKHPSSAISGNICTFCGGIVE